MFEKNKSNKLLVYEGEKEKIYKKRQTQTITYLDYKQP